MNYLKLFLRWVICGWFIVPIFGFLIFLTWLIDCPEVMGDTIDGLKKGFFQLPK